MPTFKDKLGLSKFPHYYGDVGRLFFLLGGVVMLFSLPLLNQMMPVPAYVSIFGDGTALQYSLIAFAGPFVNLFLWIGSLIILKTMKIKHRYIPLLVLTSRINMFLFIFNMIPIPGFDGYKVFSGLLSIF